MTAVLAVPLLTAPTAINYIFAVVLFMLTAYALWAYVLQRSKHAIAAAVWKQNGDWELRLRNGQLLTATLATGMFVQPSLTILRFYWGEGLKRRYSSLLLFSDSESAATLSLLRARITTDIH